MLKKKCETCGKTVTTFVVFECVNPDCSIPQHIVCYKDFMTIHLGVQELLSGE